MNLKTPKPILQKYLTLLCIPISIVALLRITGFDGLYGQDSYEYLRYTEAIKTYILTGSHPGSFFWPVLYPLLSAILSFVFETSLALQLISAISISICSIYIFKLLNLLYPTSKHQFIFVFVFLLCSPFILKMGLIAMSDALGLAFISLMFYFFFKSYYEQTSLVPVFVFATCAFMSRYASIVITIPIIIYSVSILLKQKKTKDLILATLFCFVCSLPFLILQWDNLFEASSNYFLKKWSFIHFFESQFETSDGKSSFKVPNLIYTFYVFFHPGFISIGLLLIIVTIKHFKEFFNFHHNILLTCSFMYLFFLAGIPFQNPRILALVFPLIIVLCYFSFNIISKKTLVIKFLGVLTILFFTLQVVFFTVTFKLIFTRNIIDKELTALVFPYQGKKLYSFDVDLALQGRGLDFDYKNMYLERYTHFNTADLILFNPTRYKNQWENKNPMINWNFIKTNYKLKILETHPDGWHLYEIQ